MIQHYGIETTLYGIKFRSRLEAKWAYTFSALGWKWSYEPFDLNGYIPDFAMIGWKKPLIVEVKPANSMADLDEHRRKIMDSGWTGAALIVGTAPRLDEWDHVGIVSQRGAYPEDERSDGWDFGPAVIAEGMDNRRLENPDDHPCADGSCLFAEYGAWDCYRCGIYCKWNHREDLDAIWAAACNATRWMG